MCCALSVVCVCLFVRMCGVFVLCAVVLFHGLFVGVCVCCELFDWFACVVCCLMSVVCWVLFVVCFVLLVDFV